MNRLAVACDDGVVRFFTVEEGAPGAQYQSSCAAVEGRVLCLAWHRAASTLFSGHSDATIRAWDAASGRELYRINAGESRELHVRTARGIIPQNVSMGLVGGRHPCRHGL